MKIINSVCGSAILSTLLMVLPVSRVVAEHLAVIDGKVVVLDGNSNALWINEKMVAPEYPIKALRRGEGGCVAVAFVIDPDGTTSNHGVLVSSGTGVFNDSAIEAAKKFRYQPSEQNPDRIPVIVSNTFTYQINPSKKTGDKDREELADRCTTAAKKALEPLIGGNETG